LNVNRTVVFIYKENPQPLQKLSVFGVPKQAIPEIIALLFTGIYI
jgi:hypothetical protein